MSKWYRAQKDLIEVDNNDLNIYVCSDYDGAIYVEVSIDLLTKVLKEHRKKIDKLLKELNK